MFQRAKAKRKYAKVGIYGKSGAGKTHLAMTFPKPAFIDLERGTDFFANRFDFSTVQTNNYDEIMAALGHIESGFQTEKVFDPVLGRETTRLTEVRTGVHDFETLVIDPITVLWEMIQFRQVLKIEKLDRKKDDYNQKDWGDMKRQYKSFMNRLIQLPMHVVVTGRLTELRENETMKVLGERMDAEKSTEYAFDVIVRVVNLNGADRVAIIDKDRSGLRKGGDKIDNPNWTHFRAILAKLESVSPVRAMVEAWRAAGVQDADAQALILERTGRPKTAELTPEEIEALTQEFQSRQPAETAEVAPEVPLEAADQAEAAAEAAVQ